MAASAISSKIRSPYLDKPLAKALLDPKLKLAPRKSISSLNSSLEMDLVPLPNMAANMLDTPALSPSGIGLLSIRSE